MNPLFSFSLMLFKLFDFQTLFFILVLMNSESMSEFFFSEKTCMMKIPKGLL